MLNKYNAEYYENKIAMDERSYRISSMFRAEKIQPYVGADDVVFEFGVGSGVNLHQLRCGEKIGYDINETSSLVARDYGIRIVDQLDAVVGTADVAVCHHVLEHMMNPAEGLARVYDSLRPGGIALIFVPYEFDRRYRKFVEEDENFHIYAWNVHSLANLTKACGFEVRSAGLGPFGYDRFCARLATRLGLGYRSSRILRSLALLLRGSSEVRIVATRPV
jgi:SAM-dependent methyltransferase